MKLDNILPGWVKVPGKSGKATFNVVKKEQSTLFQDIVVDGGGVSIKGSLEVDQNGDLLNANFPTYSPSEGDKTSLKAERGADGVVKVTMRGDVFDGRGFLKSAISGKEADAKSKTKNIDLDVDLKLGAVAGFNGEALRSIDSKFSRRNGVVKSFTLMASSGAIRLSPQICAVARRAGTRRDLSANQRRRCLLPLHRHVFQGRGWTIALALEPPTVEPSAKEGLINVRDFSIRGEASLDRVAAGIPPAIKAAFLFQRCAPSSPDRAAYSRSRTAS